MSELIRCAYCGAERPSIEMMLGKIIFRDRHPVSRKAFVNSKTNMYCADKPCRVHDQMAHEG